MSEDKNPIDQAVELVVYAPLGLALEARRLLPSFVERGRQQVQMARMIGQLAVQYGQSEATKRVGRLQGQTESLLADLGLTGRPAAESEPPAPMRAASPRVGPAPVRSSAAADELAIADYDSLAASQVIPLLIGLEPGELAAVRSYELAHRGRKTILGKISQLQGA